MKEYIVYVWLVAAYNGDPIIVGKFENCDVGMQVVTAEYPNAKAAHCITPDLTPPGGYKND